MKRERDRAWIAKQRSLIEFTRVLLLCPSGDNLTFSRGSIMPITDREERCLNSPCCHFCGQVLSHNDIPLLGVIGTLVFLTLSGIQTHHLEKDLIEQP